MTSNYFAYGSNMFARRLRERVPSAKAIGTHTLTTHDLRFHKKSKDGSGKCDAYCTGNPNDSIIGRLFTIDPAEEGKLDTAEGLGNGYEKKEVVVVAGNGETKTAFTYYADPNCIDTDVRPFTWYKQHVLVGAKEGGFPREYIKKIEAEPADTDPDNDRHQTEMALHD